jgi:TonB family protein
MNAVLCVTMHLLVGLLLSCSPGEGDESRPGPAVGTEPEAEVYPDPDDFVPVTREPAPLNLSAVRSAIGYPAAAKDAGIEGTVIARVLVNRKGAYVKHKLLGSPPESLAEAVEAKLSMLKFNPAIGSEGAPIPVWINLPFRFRGDSEK